MPYHLALNPLPPDLISQLPADDLLASLFEVSLGGIAIYEPIYAAPDAPTTIVDFRILLLNEIAQRIIGLPARPDQTFLQRFPSAVRTGVFEFYCRLFESRQPDHYDVDYHADGISSFYRISARRVGPVVLASFTDVSDLLTKTELALRESRQRELDACAEVERQRRSLELTFQQAPAIVCILSGPEHVFELVNPPCQALVGDRPLLGRPIREAMPELADQLIFPLLDDVYRTGQPFRAPEMLIRLDHDNSHPRELEKRYYNLVYQPRPAADGHPDGILVFAYDVTLQVLARQEVEAQEQALRQLYRRSDDLNEELAAANEELLAANEEIRASNDDLVRVEQRLRDLNLVLESRVTERTRQLQLAQATAEAERNRLHRLFMQAPAAICILGGTDLVYELVNPNYQQFFPDRPLLGRPLLEAIPELRGTDVYAGFRRVFDTGGTLENHNVLLPLARPGDGQLEDRYFNYIQQPRYDAQGQVDGVLVFGFEVTEQVQTRLRTDELQAQALQSARQLAEQRELFYQIFEQTPALICLLHGPRHEVEYANPSFGRLAPGRLLPGQPLPAVLPALGGPDFPALLDALYHSGETITRHEVPGRVHRPDGTIAEVFFSFTFQAYHQHGRIVGISLFGVDVTEQVRARQLVGQANEELLASNSALDRTNQRLTRTNQDLDNFVYTASHDLKQPIHNMAGLFRELKHGATFHDPQAALMIQMFEEALHQIDDTIRGLTEVVQTERLSGQLPAETVDLRGLAETVLQSLHPQVTAQQARFELDFAAVPAVHFARLNLQSILYNLLSNSLKYAHPERPPLIRLRSGLSAAGTPVLTVQDNGLGIDVARYGTELFQMFRRFHPHTPGSGMGLYLVNRILHQAGGHIRVEGAVNEGVSFELHFPPDARLPAGA